MLLFNLLTLGSSFCATVRDGVIFCDVVGRALLDSAEKNQDGRVSVESFVQAALVSQICLLSLPSQNLNAMHSARRLSPSPPKPQPPHAWSPWVFSHSQRCSIPPTCFQQCSQCWRQRMQTHQAACPRRFSTASYVTASTPSRQQTAIK